MFYLIQKDVKGTFIGLLKSEFVFFCRVKIKSQGIVA